MFDKHYHSGVHIGPDGSQKNTRTNPWISQGTVGSFIHSLRIKLFTLVVVAFNIFVLLPISRNWGYFPHKYSSCLN
jgi:hypothetical protein